MVITSKYYDKVSADTINCTLHMDGERFTFRTFSISIEEFRAMLKCGRDHEDIIDSILMYLYNMKMLKGEVKIEGEERDYGKQRSA